MRLWGKWNVHPAVVKMPVHFIQDLVDSRKLYTGASELAEWLIASARDQANLNQAARIRRHQAALASAALCA